MKNRVQSLDYLRGLMAFGIMVYHYYSWSGYEFGTETFLGKIGIYGVSVFYVLSGLTLYIVYHEKLTLRNTGNYFIKRIFRIFPLLWLSIALSVFVLGRKADPTMLFMNLSGLFGFFTHDKYIAIASWSIGNELVFYTLFPLVILLSRKTRLAPLLFFGISLALAVWFAFFMLSPHLTLKFQWSIYLNPLNQVVLFSGGVLAGHLFAGKKIPDKIGIALFGLAFVAFLFYPVESDQGHIVAGWNRIAFVFISFAITVSFLILDFRTGKAGGLLLSMLGEASYSVYLLHPIVFFLLRTYAGITNSTLLIYTGFTATLVFSSLVYKYFETPFIALGQRVINRLNQKPVHSSDQR